jgi:thiamine pyrophosphate-dependent acetolactate synthase large subunit-like protein
VGVSISHQDAAGGRGADDGPALGPQAAVVQVDLEETALGAHRPVDRPLELGVVGECGQTARDVLAALEGAPAASSSWRTPELAARIAREGRWRDVPFEDLSTGERIDPRVLSRELDALLPAERVVAVDSGNFMGYPSQYLSVPDERGFCFTQAFQSVGLGLATAIGAALAQPHRLPGQCGYNCLVLVSACCKIYGASGLSQFFTKKPPVLPSNFIVIWSSLNND